MSIAKGLNEKLEEQDAEKTQDVFPTVQCTPDNRRTNTLPGLSSCSKWIEQNTITYDEDGTRSKRSRNLTEKGAAYKLQTLKERRRNINGKLIRKYIIIEDLLFSIRNIVIVEEELVQFRDVFKMLLSVHDDEWFDEIDAQAFSFKRKVLVERCIRKEAIIKKLF